LTFIHRKANDADIRALAMNDLRSLDSVDPGHPDVDQNDVWLELSREFDCQLPVSGLPCDLYTRLIHQEPAQAVSKKGVVVGKQHANRHCIILII